MYVPFGKGPGKKDPYVGSVGTREWQDRTIDTRYEVTVRMDDGSYRLMKTQDASEFTTGDRVNVSQGRIERWNP
jgi:outer membrane lipoprotein SlyB